MQYLPIISTVLSLFVGVVVGLIAFGLRKQVEVIDQKIETVREEFRAQLAEAGNEFFKRVNGNYVRKDLYNQLSDRVDRVEDRVDTL